MNNNNKNNGIHLITSPPPPPPPPQPQKSRSSSNRFSSIGKITLNHKNHKKNIAKSPKRNRNIKTKDDHEDPKFMVENILISPKQEQRQEPKTMGKAQCLSLSEDLTDVLSSEDPFTNLGSSSIELSTTNSRTQKELQPSNNRNDKNNNRFYNINSISEPSSSNDYQISPQFNTTNSNTKNTDDNCSETFISNISTLGWSTLNNCNNSNIGNINNRNNYETRINPSVQEQDISQYPSIKPLQHQELQNPYNVSQQYIRMTENSERNDLQNFHHNESHYNKSHRHMNSYNGRKAIEPIILQKNEMRSDDCGDDESEFNSKVDWTPPDSAYGAACPLFGSIPKKNRKRIEMSLLGLISVAFVYSVVIISIKLSNEHSSKRSSSSTSSTSNSKINYYESTNLDDDFYVAHDQSSSLNKYYYVEINDDDDVLNDDFFDDNIQDVYGNNYGQ